MRAPFTKLPSPDDLPVRDIVFRVSGLEYWPGLNTVYNYSAVMVSPTTPLFMATNGTFLFLHKAPNNADHPQHGSGSFGGFIPTLIHKKDFNFRLFGRKKADASGKASWVYCNKVKVLSTYAAVA